MSLVSSVRVGVFLLFALVGACDGEGGGDVRDVPPGSCVAGQRICHWDASKGLETVLRCNAGEVPDAIWLIDLACEPGELCVEAACSPAS
ncbi:MAG: hypothetical protein R3F39_19485 [Myxococcota bacterium]